MGQIANTLLFKQTYLLTILKEWLVSKVFRPGIRRLTNRRARSRSAELQLHSENRARQYQGDGVGDDHRPRDDRDAVDEPECDTGADRCGLRCIPRAKDIDCTGDRLACGRFGGHGGRRLKAPFSERIEVCGGLSFRLSVNSWGSAVD